MGGIDVGGALYEQVKRGIDYAGLKSYAKLDADKGAAAMRNYVYGDWTMENTSARLVSGKDELRFEEEIKNEKGEKATALTTSQGNGRLIQMVNSGNADINAVRLGHEAYRNGVIGGGQTEEMVRAVMVHTVMADKMYRNGADFSGDANIMQDLYEFYKASASGDMSDFTKYAMDNYDSSADFWKFVERKDGSYDMYNDGTDNVTVVDENGNVKRQYNYTGGDKAEFLSGVTGISVDRLKETMSSAGWELVDNQWLNTTDNSIHFGTDLAVKLSNSVATAYNMPGLIPNIQSVNVADNFYVNQAAAVGASAWNLLALTGNATLNAAATAIGLPNYLWQTATGNGIPLEHLAATLAANTPTLFDDLAVSGYGLLNRVAASVLSKSSSLAKIASSGSPTVLGSRYPLKDGALGATERIFLMPGTEIDRYGSAMGRFFSPLNTPIEMRSLPPWNDVSQYNRYKVVKPFEVEKGLIGSYYGKPGFGIQYGSPVSAEVLKKRKIIE
jgi:hypothetical protein